jgi:hypothetical protein
VRHSLLLLLGLRDSLACAAKLQKLTLRRERLRTASIESDLTVRQPESDTLSKRACRPGTRFLYHIPGEPAAEFCIGTWVFASCVIIVTAVSSVFVTISLTSANWVKNGVTDASSAGLQAKKNEDEPLTWGALYNYTKANRKNRIERAEAASLANKISTSSIADFATPIALDPTSFKGIAAAAEISGGPQYVATALEIDEDGFSASFAPGHSITVRRQATCYEQIHIHY